MDYLHIKKYSSKSNKLLFQYKTIYNQTFVHTNFYKKKIDAKWGDYLIILIFFGSATDFFYYSKELMW